MSGKAIREAVGFLVVITSLGFVGLEIRQNTAAVRGATYQAISDMASTGTLEAATSDHLPLLAAKIRDSDPAFNDLQAEERERLRFQYLYTVRRVENVWVQVNEGVVGEAAFDRFMPTSGYIGSRAFGDFWGVTRSDLSADFVAYFENRHPFLSAN